jgi:hypothetical protein
MAATLLQTTSLTRTEGTGTTQAFTFASGVPSGSGVVLTFVHYPGGNPTGVTDNLGNTYTLTVRADANGNQAEIWHALNITSNGTTPLVITATFSAGGNYTTGVATAWSGIQALDRTASATEPATTSNTHTIAAALPNTQADMLAFTCVVVNDSVNDAGLGFSTAGWNLLWCENNSNGYEAGQAGYRHISAVETTSVTHSTTISTLLHKVLATFRVVGSGGGGASGSLAATETGSDTFAGVGVSLAQGSMIVSETATKDAFASSGVVFVSGSMATTEVAKDVFASSGSVLSAGSLTTTEVGSDTAAMSGNAIAGAVSGSLAVTEVGSDVASMSAVALVVASLAATEVGTDVFAGSSMATLSGSLAATESGPDLFTASAVSLSQGVLASVEVGSDTSLIFGAVHAQGVVSAVEVGSDVASFSGGVLGGGTLAATESGPDLLTATGFVVVQGSMTTTEVGADVFSATGFRISQGSMAAVEAGPDVLVVTGVSLAQGSMAALEVGSDVAAFSGVPISVGALAALEVGSDVFSATGSLGPVLELISDPDYTATALAETYYVRPPATQYTAVAEAISYIATAQ